MEPDATLLQADGCYLALKARDARFDGRFFTGVTSTGIYCRPVCSVRTPRRENCRFFRLPAQAEHAGFRPCLRCRPELAPQSLAWSVQDASAILARQAAQLLDEPEAWGTQVPSAARLAQRMGVSDRHVRRIFEHHFGVSPVQYLQTRRLLTAKQLLTDTDLPVTQVALQSGFGSVRRFNAAFDSHYGLTPSQLRRDGRGPDGAFTRVRLAWRPPFDVDAMLGFFAARTVQGVDFVRMDAAGGTGSPTGSGRPPTFGRTLRLDVGANVLRGWLLVRFEPQRHLAWLEVSDALREALPLVIRRVRALFDLDADPEPINQTLHAAFPHGDGLRVPGAVSGHELAVRAVLGQQVTVAAARTLAARLVARFGEPIETPHAGLDRLFPTPQTLAAADGEALGQLGIVRQRQAAIVALSRAVAQAELSLQPGADVARTITQLKALPGIGDWTAQYIAMRALRWPDAFPAGDVALQKALGVQGLDQPARRAEAASQPWKPWRSYAVVRAWSAPAPSPTPGAEP